MRPCIRRRARAGTRWWLRGPPRSPRKSGGRDANAKREVAGISKEFGKSDPTIALSITLTVIFRRFRWTWSARPRCHVQIHAAAAAGTIGSEQEDPPIGRQAWLHLVELGVNRRPKVDRRTPRRSERWTGRDPNVLRTASAAGAIR